MFAVPVTKNIITSLESVFGAVKVKRSVYLIGRNSGSLKLIPSVSTGSL